MENNIPRAQKSHKYATGWNEHSWDCKAAGNKRKDN